MAELATATVSSLNNELNAIAMSLKLLKSDAPDHSARHLLAVEEAVHRAAAALARFQQLAARQTSAAARSIALNQVLLEALDLVRPELGTIAAVDRGAVRIDAHLGELPPVLAQAGELRDIICSLFLEARDLLHDRKSATVKASTRPDRDGASLLIALPSTAEPTELVLSAAQKRVRRWGGELALESRGGQTTLRLSLMKAPAPRAPRPDGRRGVAPSRRILVVDDDDGNRETLTELLALSGHSVTAAKSGAEALAAVAAAEQPFEAALVDLAMPDMNGVALARVLADRNRGMRIALVTGWDPTVLEDIEEHDVIEAVFRKPLDLPAILRFLDGASASEASPPPLA
jgi:CheY-like chemotaxis protein